MTQEQLAELIALSIDEELPLSLRDAVNYAIATNPEAARDSATLKIAVARLKSLAEPKPDTWFVERALQGLLREHDTARLDKIMKSA